MVDGRLLKHLLLFDPRETPASDEEKILHDIRCWGRKRLYRALEESAVKILEDFPLQRTGTSYNPAPWDIAACMLQLKT